MSGINIILDLQDLIDRQYQNRRHKMSMNYQPYIIRDPDICGGEPVVKGTRVTVRTVLGSLAEDMTVAEILLDFPALDESAVRAVIAFAAVSAVSAEEDLPVQALPSIT
jgi:uncharacterized protein (DUF433 family)